MSSYRPVTAAVVTVALLGVPALADDRAPTAEERARIESILQSEGFTRWDEIEWDDDEHWEVDDAVGADGRQYDLKLDANFAIIARSGLGHRLIQTHPSPTPSTWPITFSASRPIGWTST